MKTITITTSSQGYKLKKPFVLEVSYADNKLDENIQNFIIETFTGKMPYLAQFAFQNRSVMNIAKHLLLHSTRSYATLFNYIYDVYSFTQWLKTTPDKILSECISSDGSKNPIAVVKTTQSLDAYTNFLLTERQLARTTAYNMIKFVQLFFKINGLPIKLPYRLRKWSFYEDRSPTQEELQDVLKVANLREKVIISALASGGFRIGTLARLKYRHVKKDLERHMFPIHVHVEGDITKTKFYDYDTFLSSEASHYLQTYLQMRREGKYKEGLKSFPPEDINDDSPLIGFGLRKKPLTPGRLSDIVHKLYVRAGLISDNRGVLNSNPLSRRRYDLRPHSTRKFFRSQFAFLGIDQNIIEYMMGHKVNSYFDVKMKGIEYLRSIYLQSGFSIMPQTRENRIQALRGIALCWGFNPNEIFSNEGGN